MSQLIPSYLFFFKKIYFSNVVLPIEISGLGTSNLPIYAHRCT